MIDNTSGLVALCVTVIAVVYLMSSNDDVVEKQISKSRIQQLTNRNIEIHSDDLSEDDETTTGDSHDDITPNPDTEEIPFPKSPQLSNQNGDNISENDNANDPHHGNDDTNYADVDDAFETMRNNFNHTVPFYVYDGPAFDWYKNCSKTHKNKLDELWNYKHGSSLRFVKAVLEHKDRVMDPEKAKIFVIPVLLGILMHINSCNHRSASQMQTETAKAVLASKYWHRHSGVDHVVLDTDFRVEERFSRLGRIKSLLNNLTIGHHITKPFLNHNKGDYYSFRGMTNWAACQVIVPMVDQPVAKETEFGLANFKKRPFDLFFMGQADKRRGYSVRRLVGSRLKEMTARTYIYGVTGRGAKSMKACDFETCINQTHRCKCAVNKGASKYPLLLGKSKFSLAFGGDNPTSSRIYDSLSSGTIPIFLSDQVYTDGLAFPQKIPWVDLSFHIPANAHSSGKQIKDMLEGILSVKEKVIKKKLKALMMYRDDTSWQRRADKVAENFISEAWYRCARPTIYRK